VETSATDTAVTLTVTDTGLRAHEPFFTTKGVKSTGLGLSVAFGIARRHGGARHPQRAGPGHDRADHAAGGARPATREALADAVGRLGLGDR
jgi:hypothetical protein